MDLGIYAAAIFLTGFFLLSASTLKGRLLLIHFRHLIHQFFFMIILIAQLYCVLNNFFPSPYLIFLSTYRAIPSPKKIFSPSINRWMERCKRRSSEGRTELAHVMLSRDGGRAKLNFSGKDKCLLHRYIVTLLHCYIFPFCVTHAEDGIEGW